MEKNAYLIDDQAVDPTFFGESRWLTSYITPDEPDIQVIYDRITKGLTTIEDKIEACWDYVAHNIKYRPFVKAAINVGGRVSKQSDYWQLPSQCARTKIGNCANMAFLLTSLLRYGLPEEDINCVFGNLHNNGKIEGHAWVEWSAYDGQDYIIEATRGDVPMVLATTKDRYEPIHYFNESLVYAIPGRTVMRPFSASYSEWLKDYLSFDYINANRRQ